jgi:hypothetical protein
MLQMPPHAQPPPPAAPGFFPMPAANFHPSARPVVAPAFLRPGFVPRPGFGFRGPMAFPGSLGAPARPLPPWTQPHQDFSLSFDFEPAIEEDVVSVEAKRVAKQRAIDPRFKTVVCMHWVNGLCMKAEHCEFLHEMDTERMPDCRQGGLCTPRRLSEHQLTSPRVRAPSAGQRCTDKTCAFKHVKDEERPLCNNYRLGFCQHGATCRYQHRKRPAEELPQISEICFVGGSGGGGDMTGGDAESFRPSAASAMAASSAAPSRALVKGLPEPQSRNPNWRTAMCHSFMNTGTCSYGDGCNYAHSEEEMNRNIMTRNALFAQPPPPPSAQLPALGPMAGRGPAAPPRGPMVSTVAKVRPGPALPLMLLH